MTHNNSKKMQMIQNFNHESWLKLGITRPRLFSKNKKKRENFGYKVNPSASWLGPYLHQVAAILQLYLPLIPPTCCSRRAMKWTIYIWYRIESKSKDVGSHWQYRNDLEWWPRCPNPPMGYHRGCSRGHLQDIKPVDPPKTTGYYRVWSMGYHDDGRL